MAQATLEQRVDNLEELMAELLRASIRTQQQVEQTSRELRDFKDEMRENNRQMNKRWGELANKRGTMAEDLVAPSISRILRTVVDCPADAIESTAVRVRRRHASGRATRQMQEFDVVAACGEYVLINETKSSLEPEDVRDFVELLG